MQCIFHFNNAQGQCAFITSGTSEAYENTDGIYEATCFVPGSLLNNDIYFIDLALTFMKKGKHVSFWQKGALAVVIRDELDITIDKERHGFSGAIPGVIRPKLSWEVKKVS